ncbi:Uncharacterised protein [Actinobacillus pleuropneumoniae]|nr:Uncharacterised protein [Actinobacillus pleuropneumoniae]
MLEIAPNGVDEDRGSAISPKRAYNGDQADTGSVIAPQSRMNAR